MIITPLTRTTLRHCPSFLFTVTKPPFFTVLKHRVRNILYHPSNAPVVKLPAFRTAEQIQSHNIKSKAKEVVQPEEPKVDEVDEQESKPRKVVQYQHRVINGYNSTTATVKEIDPQKLQILNEDNIGLNLFLNRVYVTTGASILMALGTVNIASSIPYFVMNPLMCIGYGSVMTLSGMLGAYFIKPHIVVEEEEGHQHMKTRNGIVRGSLYIMGWMGLGLMSMPFANMLSSLMPMIVPNLMAMTIGCFGGASIVIAGMPRMPLFTYGGLLGGLVGSILSIRLMQQFNAMIYGQHFLSNFMQILDMYGGTLVFMFFVYYNTVKAKEAYEAGNSDHLEVSIKFYYDMVNYIKRLFVFLFKKRQGTGQGVEKAERGEKLDKTE